MVDETTDEADEAVMAVSVIATTHLLLLGIEQVASGEHNGIGYAACVQRIWGRYNLEGVAVRRFVTDNDSNWDKAWRAVDDKEGGGLCTLWPYAKRQRCFCHVLNLVMEELEEHSAVKELAHAITVVRRLVSGVRNQQRRHRMKEQIGDIMPDPVATRHDSWMRTAVWVRKRTQQRRGWLAKEAIDYLSAGTRAALEWVRRHGAAIYRHAVWSSSATTWLRCTINWRHKPCPHGG